MSETALLFSGWILFPPEISLFLRNGLFITPTILALFQLYKNCTPCRRQDYNRLVNEVDSNGENDTTTDEDDANSDEDDANADEDHANSDEDHANSDEDDANSDEDDANSDEDHANADEDHANSDEEDANSDEDQANSEKDDANSEKDDANSDEDDANSEKDDTDNGNDDTNSVDSLEDYKRKKRCCILNTILQVAGLLIQFVGMVLVCTFIGFDIKKTAPVLTWVVLGGTVVFSLLLSTIWTSKVQRMLTIANVTNLSPHARRHDPTARWKASRCMQQSMQRVIKTISYSYADFIGATVRLLLYPFTSYLIFRYTYQLNLGANSVAIDPWCLLNGISLRESFNQWEYQEVTIFVTHITCSFLAYSFSWIACFMTLHKYGLALPVFIATPASLAVFEFMVYFKADLGFKINGIFQTPTVDTSVQMWLILAFSFAVLLWIGQLMITLIEMWTTKNFILASDKDMFLRPYYNSILLEQYLIINRDVNQCKNARRKNDGTVFICSTMFRENAMEMKQMLVSLRRVAAFCKSARNGTSNSTKFESHIFFDGGCNGENILQFGVQLLSLIPNTLGVKLEEVKKCLTPYGCRFEWTIEADKDMTGMPFVIHFKDNNKVKNKKRWSQVMYMNYVINYRIKKDRIEKARIKKDTIKKDGTKNKKYLDLNNTFILTTDADIAFKAESAVVLLDMLARDPHVGAVSSRTHPKGSGLLYWYQVFDYAIGHWLQKPAEHILGCVLCCPGCFSIFRCSALKDCLKTYSEEVTSAFDFLTKDMGEDRWLCTLLVENGWRLEYCAISRDETFCPEEFDEFFKQRRRWIPSTVANLWLLVSSAKKITRNNKTINFLFILYQLLIILSTIISPATVILIISASLAQSHVNQAILTGSLVIISLLYGLVCLYTNQKTQLDFAKLLTLFFAILMVVVVVGLIKGVVDDIESLFVNNTANGHFKLPVDVSTLYSGFFALVFPITAILHYREWWCLLQCIWYLLGLPGGYLVLLIYSAANLNSRSWGTREVKSNDDNENIIIVLYKKLKKKLSSCVCCWKYAQKKQSAICTTEDKSVGTEMESKTPVREISDLEHSGMCGDANIQNTMQLHVYSCLGSASSRKYKWLTKWLKKNDCSVSK